MPQISFVGSVSHTGTNATSINATIPSGVVNGDFLLVALNKTTTGTGTIPSGWTLLNSTNYSNGALTTWWKLAFNEPASYSVTFSSADVGIVTSAFRGCDITNPIDTSSSHATTIVTTTMGVTPISTSKDNEMIIWCGGAETVNNAVFMTRPSALTSAGNANSPISPFTLLIVAYALLSPAQTTPASYDQGSLNNGGAKNGVQLIALRYPPSYELYDVFG